MMNRNVMWLGPISVLGFVVILAIMYGWVGSVNSVGYEVRDRPETAQTDPPDQPDTPDLAGNPAEPGDLQPEPDGRLAHYGQFPAGIANGQIQLISNKTIPTGIGNSQIQLINQNRPGGPYLGLNLF